VLEDGGLPLPTTQFRPEWLRQVNGRVDLAYQDEKVLIECDSLRWHGTTEAVQLDRHRDNLAQLAGWTSLRFTYEDLKKRPSYVVDTVRAALFKRSKAEIPPAQH
jgi:very-short-patch-repair endonuclease